MEENLNLINAIIALLASLTVFVPWVMSLRHKLEKKDYTGAIHDLQRSIGEGGEINDVVKRISQIANPIIEKELPKSGAKVISTKP